MSDHPVSTNYGLFLSVLAVAGLLIVCVICAYILVRTNIDAYSTQALIAKCHNITLLLQADNHPVTPFDHNIKEFYQNEYIQVNCKAVLGK
jgi:hypothetical protein